MFGTWRFFDTLKRQGPRFSAVVVALGALYLIVSSGSATAAPLGAPAPDIMAISPGEGYNSQPTDVTITGLNFTATPTVTLGIMPLPNVTFVSTTTLTATVPADLPGGSYGLTVTNPDGQSASLADGFTVLLLGDGTLGRWQRATSSMTTVRDWPAAVAIGRYLYVLGGGNPDWMAFQLSSVERAAINADGSLGTWQTMAAMTRGRSTFAAVEYGGYLYAIGGREPSSSVERAAINADATLGPWASATPMGLERRYVAAVAWNGYIYAIGGEAAYSHASVERTVVGPDGAIGPWQTVTPMTTPRGQHSAVAVGNSIYVLGGQNPPYGPFTSVERTTINGDGSLATWETVASMIVPRMNLAAAAVGGYIYAIGGSDSHGVIYETVERAKVNADGSLGPWELTTSMTSPRWRLAAAQGDGFIYALGGAVDEWSGLNTVEFSEINPPVPPLLDYGVSINGGALFTNKVNVTLTIGAAPDTREAQVSNDGGFSGAQWEPYAREKTWQITRYGNYVIPRVVYVRYKDYEGTVSSTYQDDIILDVNAPTGSVNAVPGVSSIGIDGPSTGAPPDSGDIKAADDSHTVYLPLALRCYPPLPTGPANVTLKLSATDDVSGVADMMISNRADFFCESWETYATSKGWYVPSGTTTIYVKFRDNAGNVSDVATDTISR